jgi:hypothetical protein
MLYQSWRGEMSDKPIKVPLNVHLETMVTPKSCLLGYIKCKVEVAAGNYEEGDKDYFYVQFCCGRCGELIQLVERISYIYYNLSRDTHYCKHCKTPHRYLSNENEKYIFAIPVKEGSK